MPAFAYKCASASNKIVKGVREAPSAAALARGLEAEGLVPLSIVEAAPGKRQTAQENAPALSRAGLMLFIANLEMLLSAGMDLNGALSSLLKSSQKKELQALLTRLREAVQKGQSLSDALAASPLKIPGFIISSLRAGEASGQLKAVLAKLSDYLARFEKFRSDLISSLIYPVILLLMAAAAIVILVTVVIPQFKPLFEDAGTELPLLTRIVIGSSDLVLEHWLLIAAGIAILAVLGRAMAKDAQLAAAIDRAKLNLPLGAGALLRKMEAARFSRLLGLLLENGLPLLSALSLVRDAATNRAFAVAIDSVAAKVREGGRFASALRATKIVPPAYQELLEAGEEASQLERVLNRVADLAERETDIALKNFMAAFVPILTIVLGGVVAVIIMSVLFALLNINDLALR